VLRYILAGAVFVVLMHRIMRGGWSVDRVRKDLSGAVIVSAFLFLVLKVAGLPV